MWLKHGYIFLLPIHATCCIYFVRFYLITLTIFGEEQKLCSVLHIPVLPFSRVHISSSAITININAKTQINIEVSNQLDATKFSFINLLNQPYMFRATDSPILRSTYDCIYSFWYNAPTAGRQQCRCIVPKAVYTVIKVLLRMDEFVAGNM